MLTILAAALALGAIDIPRLTGDPLSVKGDAWKNRGLPIVAMVGAGPDLPTFDQFGATVKLGWNEEGLAAQFEVTDATPTVSSNPERPYEGDSVELYLGLPRTNQMVQLVVSRTGKRFFDYRASAMHGQPLVGRSSMTATKTGYTARVLVAWKNLGIDAKTGVEVGARVAVNNAGSSRDRDGLIWQGGDFFALPVVRLAEKAGEAPKIAIWGAATSDLTSNVVNVIADPSLAGRELTVGGEKTKLTTDGLRAAAQVILSSSGEVSASIEGEGTQTVSLPDLAQLRKSAFARGITSHQEAGIFGAKFESAIFPGPEFPRYGFTDQPAVEKLVGPVRTETKFYDEDGNPVEHAERPGRYGSIVHAQSEKGGEATAYWTLFKGSGSSDPLSLAARLEGKTDAEKADRDWWHGLRKKLGTAVHYESYLRFPEGDATKKWPLIVYLHGSGGGDEGAWENTKRFDGPMGFAGSHKEFPFAILALRSPGGWYPPAVKDAIDEAMKTGRIDETRIILCGFSMGAMGTWSVSYDEPNRFAAIAVVGGRRGDAGHMPLIRHVPAWVFNGEQDEATLASDARAAVKALRGAGGNVRYTQIPGATHVDSLRIAFAKPELYDWMAKQRLH